ncbi:intraflagellar transport protein 22 homolog isoform X2 [Paramacrobiotus metropolitanus]|uniref:intraflagellar transport protein 22 homolog isoform X2 n=1 Tax=Paramacrobiotus metropolitanus TaxID=2943436 RepID=UPI00244591C8|nr:intraflagellar transport protein 22 homolog isoform X2 [Paramacrobiotus metropolitanus]
MKRSIYFFLHLKLLKEMQNERILKIIFVGPASSGKSLLVNILSQQIDITKISYRPTKAVRIVETDVKEIPKEVSILPKNIGIQLWDLGGDKHNQQYWNSALYNADGVVLVYNADRPGQDRELETIAYFFNQRPENAILKPVSDSRCFVIANSQRQQDRYRNADKSLLPSSISNKLSSAHT